MAKIVKIPLVMKNGEKATDMKTLKDNFDVESVMGYFLDGKLEKWLNDRYYEDEAETIAALDKDAPDLARKLCEVFDMEYTKSDEIDPEEIAWRNERLARLKQLTADEDVLQNIDSTAFDQEELAELYDRGIEKIYLCEGEFRIPKSKRDLEYILIGDATADGLPEKKQDNPVDFPRFGLNSAVPTEISMKAADLIKMNPYVIMDSAFLTFERHTIFGSMIGSLSKIFRVDEDNSVADTDTTMDGKFKVYDNDGTPKFSFDVPGYERTPRQKEIAVNGSRVFLSSSGVLVYDFESKKQEIICSDISDRSDRNRISVSNGKVAYINGDYDLKIYDIDSKKSITVEQPGYTAGTPQFLLTETGLFYDKDSSIYWYDITQKKSIRIFEDNGMIIQQMLYFDGIVYVFEYNVYDNYVRFLGFNTQNPVEKPAEYFRFTVKDSYGLDQCIQNAPYFVFVKCEYSFPVYVFDMKKKTLNKVADKCGYTSKTEKTLFSKPETLYYANDFQVVGDYLYFQKGEEQELYRLNLATLDGEVRCEE